MLNPIKTVSWPVSVKCSLCLGILTLVNCAANPSILQADIPTFVGDGELVERSELIVIGRLEGESLQKIRHPRGFSSEYHAMLLIKEFLKGDLKDRQITLLIQHGVDVRTEQDGIRLEDDVTVLPRTAIDDARQDQIWFLRKIQSGDGQPNAPHMWGIRQIQDIQGIGLTDYFKILLSPQPEPKVRAYLKSRPHLAVRAVEYLESREINRILKEPDPATRYQMLLPYSFGAAHEATRSSASRALSDGGPESGPYLMAAFHRYGYARERPGIIRIWASTGYSGCADVLVRLLDENHRSYIDLHGRLERQGPESRINPQDVEQLASEVRAAIYALAEIGDPRAEQLVAETRRRWSEIPSARKEILEVCDLAMERIGRQKHKAP